MKCWLANGDLRRSWLHLASYKKCEWVNGVYGKAILIATECAEKLGEFDSHYHHYDRYRYNNE